MFRRHLIILLLATVSCTEKVGIEPGFSDITDWAPDMTVEHNNYRRVELHFSELPQLEVERNLYRLFVQFRKPSETEFRSLDSLDLEFRRWLTSRYLTEPVLQENTEYECRVLVQYRNGVEQVSNTVRLVTPVVKGQIVDSIAYPPPFECSHCSPVAFGFSETSILVLSSRDELIRSDRSTLEATRLLSDFVPSDKYSAYFRGITVYADTAILAENSASEPGKMTVVRVNLATLEIDKSLKIPFPVEQDIVYGQIIHYDGAEIYVLWNIISAANSEDGPSQQQIARLNAVTGEAVEVFPAFDAQVDHDDVLIFDGADFRIAINDDFDNRIAGFDPNGGIVPPVHRNPVFRSRQVAWDGDNFWVFDYQIASFVKLKLEGL